MNMQTLDLSFVVTTWCFGVKPGRLDTDLMWRDPGPEFRQFGVSNGGDERTLFEDLET